MPRELSAAANAALPVARIMSIPELFSTIMHFALDVYMPNMPRYRASDLQARTFWTPQIRVLGAAVVVSHVCTAWRTLCIDTPTLWARQIGLVAPAVAEFLARSSNARLEIYWDRYRDPGRTKELLWPAAYFVEPLRLKSLVWNHSGSDSSGIQTTLSGPLWNLVVLELHDIQWDCLNAISHDTHTLDLPQLVHLSLESVNTDLYAVFNAPRLIKMTLDRMTVSASSLVSTLRRSPLLEEFVIMWCEYVIPAVDEPQRQDASRTQPLKLPNLRLLDLFDDSGDSGALFTFHQIVSLLSTDPRTLSVTLPSGWTESLLSICLHHIFARDAPDYLLIEEELEFYRSADIYPPQLPPKLHGRAHKRGYLGHPDLMWLFPAFSQLGMHEQLSNITTVVMHTRNADYLNDGEEHVRLMLCALPSVETYWVSSASGCEGEDGIPRDCLWKSLAPTTTRDGRKLLPFPRLRTLGLDISADKYTRILDDISVILESRQDYGMSMIDTLSFPSITCPPLDDDATATRRRLLEQAIYWAPPGAAVSTTLAVT